MGKCCTDMKIGRESGGIMVNDGKRRDDLMFLLISIY